MPGRGPLDSEETRSRATVLLAEALDVPVDQLISPADEPK
jgi:hypothetical protein